MSQAASARAARAIPIHAAPPSRAVAGTTKAAVTRLSDPTVAVAPGRTPVLARRGSGTATLVLPALRSPDRGLRLNWTCAGSGDLTVVVAGKPLIGGACGPEGGNVIRAGDFPAALLTSSHWTISAPPTVTWWAVVSHA
jgi:hypothetical protein